MGRHNAKRKADALRRRVHVRKDDLVMVNAGRDKGKTGRVLDVDRVRGRALVEGINLVKRHTQPNPARGTREPDSYFEPDADRLGREADAG